jgi:periplasmic protein CpxP/Spy
MKFHPMYALIAVPVLVGAVVPFALAQTHPGSATMMAQFGGPGGKFEQFREQRQEKLIQELSLTADQVTTLEQLRTEQEGQRDPNREALKSAFSEMRTLVGSSASEAELRQQHQEIQSLMQQLGDQRFENKLKMYQVLTPEQRSKLAQLLEEHGSGKQGGPFRDRRSEGPANVSLFDPGF